MRLMEYDPTANPPNEYHRNSIDVSSAAIRQHLGRRVLHIGCTRQKQGVPPMRSFSSWKTPLFSVGLLVAAAVYLSSLGVRSPATAEPSDRSTKAAEIDVDREAVKFRFETFRVFLEERGGEDPWIAKTAEELRRELKACKVSSAYEAEKVAADDKLRRQRVPVKEDANFACLLRSWGNYGKFLTRGDLIWVVQLQSRRGDVTQEVWINARTGEIRWMLPFEELNYESPPSASKSRPAKQSKTTAIDVEKVRGGLLRFLEERNNEGPVSQEAAELRKELKACKVSSAYEANRVAANAKRPFVWLPATAGWCVASLVRSGVTCGKFLSRGDFIWVVQLKVDFNWGDVMQEAWINARTGEIRWMLPFEELSYESPPSDR